MIAYCPSLHTPWDDPDPPCLVCDGLTDCKPSDPRACICPECPVCEEIGDVECYVPMPAGKGHMTVNAEQAAKRDEARARYAAEVEAEAAALDADYRHDAWLQEQGY